MASRGGGGGWGVAVSQHDMIGLTEPMKTSGTFVPSHEKRDIGFMQFWMLYFQRISSDYLEITTAVIVLCGVPKKSPHTVI